MQNKGHIGVTQNKQMPTDHTIHTQDLGLLFSVCVAVSATIIDISQLGIAIPDRFFQSRDSGFLIPGSRRD